MIETQQINQPQQGLESKVQSTIFLMIEEHHLAFYFLKLKISYFKSVHTKSGFVCEFVEPSELL